MKKMQVKRSGAAHEAAHEAVAGEMEEEEGKPRNP